MTNPRTRGTTALGLLAIVLATLLMITFLVSHQNPPKEPNPWAESDRAMIEQGNQLKKVDAQLTDLSDQINLLRKQRDAYWNLAATSQNFSKVEAKMLSELAAGKDRFEVLSKYNNELQYEGKLVEKYCKEAAAVDVEIEKERLKHNMPR